MHWLTQPGTGADEERRVSVARLQDLREIPGVRNCGSHIGQALLADEVYGVDFGENWISVDPDVDYDKTLASVHRTVEGYPGLYRDVQTYLRERIKEVLTGTSESIVVRIFGPDLDVLREKADEVEEKIADIDGVVDAHADLQDDLPHIEVELDLAAARRLRPQAGRHPPAVVHADRQRGGRRHLLRRPGLRRARVGDPCRARQRDRRRAAPDRHAERRPDPPCPSVADVRLAPTPNAIERELQSRRIDVGANVEGRDLASVVDDVEERLETVEFPLGYHAEVLGESTELNAAQGRLLLFGIGAAIAIFLLLHAAFGSLRLAVLTFLLLPMALVGGVLAVWLGDGVLSLGSLVGFLTVFGIAARNGILMISHFQHLERFEGRDLRAGAGAARRAGAAGADPDDGAGDRPRARAAGGRRQHPGPRDRAPDGDRHPRRSRHLDAAQPVRPARRCTCASPSPRARRAGDGSRAVPRRQRRPRRASADGGGS